jgi:hypothetical protein
MPLNPVTNIPGYHDLGEQQKRFEAWVAQFQGSVDGMVIDAVSTFFRMFDCQAKVVLPQPAEIVPLDEE